MKTIIIIGSGYSGSSAVYEFLKISNFFFDPFPSQEFSITYDPGGIMELENCIQENFTPNKNTIAYKKFLQNIRYYTNKPSELKPGKNLKIDNNNLYVMLTDYLDSITDIKYEGYSNYLIFNDTVIKNLVRKIKKKFAKKHKGEMVLFCEINEFKKKTKEFFDVLFLKNNEKKMDVILNQAGCIWSPISSTKYFPNPKAIVIYRDPRDIFSEFRGKTANSYPGTNVDQFCSWYENIMLKINKDEINQSNVLKVNFEDFVLENKEVIKKIYDHVEIKEIRDKNNFDFSKSKNNIYRYKNNLDKNEIEIIEKKLKKYLHY